MAFKDIAQIIEPLTLTICGKEYTISPMGVLDIARYEQALAEPEEHPLTNEELQRLCLGDAYELMRTDNVAPAYMVRATLTALADTVRGRAAAEIMWETGADPKAIQARVQALVPEETTPLAVASTTRRRATGSGTKTSRKS